MRFVALLILFFLPFEALAGDLTIATFNAEFLTRPKVHIKFGRAFDMTNADEIAQWNEPGFRDQKFAEAAAAVAKVVAGINADVMVLTEVGNEQDVAELNAAIAALGVTYPHVAVCQCTDTSTWQHVAMLSKLPLTDTLPLIAEREGYFAESDDDDSEEDTSISKSLAVNFTFEGHRFRLYGLHLRSESSGADADEQRIAQASIIRRLTLPAIMDGNEHFIVAGDLNDGRGQPALRRIRGFDDIWPDLIQTGDHRYFKGREDTRWTYVFRGVRNQIDHILLSPSIGRLVGQRNKIQPVVPEQSDPLVSDHRPFVLTLKLP
jgi:endonuclease/exonuclease/phosphatase family metal-dependent hydrolase